MKGKLTVWRTPGSYFGFNPVGHILVASMHRESSILDQSNFWTTWHWLRKAAALESIPDLADTAKDGPFSRFDPNTSPLLYVWQASHSLVGWERYLMIRPCRDSRGLCAVARDIAARIEAYPVLDDDDYSERQIEAMENYWKPEPLKQRLYWCREAGASIFAARRDSPPEKVESHWRDGEMFA